MQAFNGSGKIAPESAANFERNLLIPAGVAMLLAFIGFFIWWNYSDTKQKSDNQLYLLPWILLTAVVVATPSVILIYQKKFDLFHPLVFAAWSYFAIAFVIGGFLLALGVTQPYFMYLIENPEYNLPLTFFYISLGYAGLSLGFAVPWARKMGGWLGQRILPKLDWQPNQILFPSIALLGIGFFFFFSAWFAGSVGYQQIDAADSLSSFNYFFSLLTLEASFLMWMFIFKSKHLTLFNVVSLALLTLAGLSRTILGGNKSSLVLILVLILMAFVYSGRRLKSRHLVIFGVLGAAALLVGVIYGTTFRQIRGSESKTSLNEYVANAGQAVELMMTQDSSKTLSAGFASIAERIEVGSSLAVIVANYEKLAPYEAAYGLENNIWTYTWTAFIPRILWANKPIVSDARGYSDLYFNYGENSFAMTPMGDLLRNFGPFGIPLGMMVLGFALRIVYAALIENQPLTIGRATAFYMLLTSVSYEGFYGTILPSLIRVSFVVVVSLALVNLLAVSQKRTV